jgi:ankyrin repeat protein
MIKKSLRVLLVASMASGVAMGAINANYGLTPLHIASFMGKTERVSELIAGGADVNAKIKKCDTPLHIAEVIQNREAAGDNANDIGFCDGAPNMEFYYAYGNETPLHIAVCTGSPETVKLLIAGVADINAVNDLGNTPLHFTAPGGNPEVVQALIKAGADVHATNLAGQTPLHVAAYNGRLEVVNALLGANAYVGATDSDGKQPLHYAVQNGHLEVVRALVAAGANTNTVDNDGKTALLRAHHQDVITVLRAEMSANWCVIS